MEVDLSKFSSKTFDRGASRIKEILWVAIRCLFFLSTWPVPSAWRVAWLRCFGAEIGQGVVIRSRVYVHFPWRLKMGNNVWLGEEAYLLNLAPILMESNVCISQRSFLCTGSHDYTSGSFDLITKPITLEKGAWIGAASWVGPGVRIGTHAVLAAASVATKSLNPWGVYQGNPATFVRKRVLL